MLVRLSCARNAKFLAIKKNAQLSSTVAYRLIHLIAKGLFLSMFIRVGHAEELGAIPSTYVCLVIKQNIIANVLEFFKLNSKVSY